MNLAARDHAVIWHPFTQQKNRPHPIPIVKARGSLLYGENGQTYIDAISSWWVTLHGHAHPYIAEKIYQQALELEQVIFAGFTHEPAVALAERILPKLPGNFSRVFYSDNGSTSTEVALKMAIQFWWNQKQPQRNKILAFRNAYHGDTFGAMSVSDRSVFTLAFHDLLFEVLFIDTPTTDNIQSLQNLIAEQGDTIAAFIYEPLVQGAGGMKMYDAKPMDMLMSNIRDAGIICIADEVMTGFGRTGKLFASSYLAQSPDIICLSKGLTGGTMALGITACNDSIYQAYVTDDKYQTFFHGHSFTANPIACTAALASLDLLENTDCALSIDRISESNQVFATELKSYPQLKQLRQLGTILAFEIAQGKDEYLNNLSPMITDLALAEGVYLRPLGNTVYLMPPYCITEEELQRIYEVIRLLLAKITSRNG
ncbi:MAG: adenosylmethionine--8-amino-7-oxononanoate transaminase [Bacteroidota bacterium]|nr:adenosylmethionine--8-amino-7-oxononanoate transaminase [Bacteroidota bacterium]